MLILHRLRIDYPKKFVHIMKKCFSSKIKDSSQLLLVQKQGPITLIGLNRPEKKNAINYEMTSCIMDALSEVESDLGCKAVVIYGERGNLSVGCDEDEINIDIDICEKMSSSLTDRYLRVPTIAAVSGYTQGLGFELALWCDFRVIEESAIMGFPKTNIPLSQSRANKLVNILGYQKTIDWVLTGRMVRGKETFECGIANRLVAVGSSLGQAYNLASGLVLTSLECNNANRAAIYLSSKKLPIEYNEVLENEQRINFEAAMKGVFLEKDTKNNKS